MKIFPGKKRFFIPVALSAALLSSFVMAHEKNAEDYSNRVAEKLSLTETQKNEFTDVMQGQREKRKVIIDELREMKKAKFQMLREETRMELETVLTPEQLALVDEKMEKRMKKMDRHGEKSRWHDKHH